ncbi:MAG TPA: type II toxin-antitoxin system HigB family toxin [Rhizomicrobium sp.]
MRNWHSTAGNAEWKKPADAKAAFGANVDFVGDKRPIFDIAGNKYRLVVHVSYSYRRVLIKFVGTHKEHDRIDPMSA